MALRGNTPRKPKTGPKEKAKAQDKRTPRKPKTGPKEKATAQDRRTQESPRQAHNLASTPLQQRRREGARSCPTRPLAIRRLAVDQAVSLRSSSRSHKCNTSNGETHRKHRNTEVEKQTPKNTTPSEMQLEAEFFFHHPFRKQATADFSESGQTL